MSAFPSAYLDDEILDAIFNNSTFTVGANLYLALYTTNPTAANTGTEVTGGSYARQAASFAASSGGAITTDADITFTNLPSATITHYGILDALTGGNLIVYGQLPVTIIANSGDDVTISAGNIDFTFVGS